MKKLIFCTISVLLVFSILCSCSNLESTYTSEYYTHGEYVDNGNNSQNTNTDNLKTDNELENDKMDESNPSNNTSIPNYKPGDTVIKQDYSEKKIYLSIYNENIKTQGRCYDSVNGIGADLTGCGFEFNAFIKGDIEIDISASNQQHFIAVIDGKESDIIKVSGSSLTSTVTIAKGLKEGKHNIKFYKTSQVSQCDLISITFSGYFDTAPAKSKLNIEIIGDSITCGAGGVITINYNGTKITDHNGDIANVMVAFNRKGSSTIERFEIDNFSFNSSSGKYSVKLSSSKQYFYSNSQYDCKMEFYDKNGSLIASVPYGQGVTYGENGYNGYAVKTARKLGADWNILSQSGASIKEMYGRYEKQYGRNESLSYSPSRKADIVIINLATNGINDADYTTTMTNFVTLLRKHHPNAKIIFAYGAMTDWMYESFHDKITSTVASLGGKAKGIYSFRFTLSRDGLNGHPSMANHERMSTELAKFIKDNGLA